MLLRIFTSRVRFNLRTTFYLKNAALSPQNGFFYFSSSTQGTPVFLKAQKYADRTAIIDRNGSHSYLDLLQQSCLLSQKISSVLGASDDVKGERIAFLCPNDVSYVISQWSAWISGGVAVPLCKTHPVPELEYVLSDSQASVLLYTEDYADKAAIVAENTNIKVLQLRRENYIQKENEDMKTKVDECVDILLDLGSRSWKDRDAMIVYTSGTTGRPKGVLTTHKNLQAQVEAMVETWEWSPTDVLLHVLPLHHVHGIVNCLVTPLWAGAMVTMMEQFSAENAWKALLSASLLSQWSDSVSPRMNVFMAVPTVYAKMIEHYDKHYTKPRVRDYVKAVCREKVRLMVSGSAALPQPIMERWEEITGHWLLERYGMTEIGMALTNPLHGDRRPGTVGRPLPGVEVRIAQQTSAADPQQTTVVAQGNHSYTQVSPGMEEQEGELLVKGPAVFKQYWNRPDATTDAFTQDGWFKTGDTAVLRDGYFSIMGRTSVDIIKSGGYKISALDVERHLLAHDGIADCAVVGVSDMTWGQRVVALVVLREGASLSLGELKDWGKDRMPSYIIPSEIKVVPFLPRNAMGKVNKKELLKEFFPETAS
ncbi:malonate--CoA ligase ACSF3, mitochondrial-like [Branchiostoma lanceolatum]|uniref:malonate--CoA ligase ACSF3, mitochondrial-like n=1 Tax=Branchiostoma lanceolatum TaxID=7740 RepID=UPI00345177D5